MCGFYDDKQKIKKDDIAIYKGQNITIHTVTHIKQNKTMDIVYSIDETKEKELINIPYHTGGYGLELQLRG